MTDTPGWGDVAGVGTGTGEGFAAGAWGISEGPTNDGGTEEPPSGQIGDGTFIEIDAEQWRALLHHPAQAIADTANSTAITRWNRPAPQYSALIQNASNTSRLLSSRARHLRRDSFDQHGEPSVSYPSWPESDITHQAMHLTRRTFASAFTKDQHGQIEH